MHTRTQTRPHAHASAGRAACLAPRSTRAGRLFDTHVTPSDSSQLMNYSRRKKAARLPPRRCGLGPAGGEQCVFINTAAAARPGEVRVAAPYLLLPSRGAHIWSRPGPVQVTWNHRWPLPTSPTHHQYHRRRLKNRHQYRLNSDSRDTIGYRPEQISNTRDTQR